MKHFHCNPMNCQRGAVHVGNPHGKIAIWCDETEAVDLANHYGPSDDFFREVMDAVEKAYPESE